MNFKQLEKNLERIEKLQSHVDTIEKVSETNVEFVNSAIVELSKNEVSPDSEDGKKITWIAERFRNFGQRMLNLFEINISCSFAGVTLFTWRLPKLENNKLKVKK